MLTKYFNLLRTLPQVDNGKIVGKKGIELHLEEVQVVLKWTNEDDRVLDEKVSSCLL